MKRVAALVACSVLLGGCESLQSLTGGGAPTPITLTFESEPDGAEVTLANGASCRTPCGLPLTPSEDVTATFALPKHRSVTLTARAVAAEKNMLGAQSVPARFEPNPLRAELKPVPVLRRRRPINRPARSPAKPPTQTSSRSANTPAPATPAAPGSVPTTSPPPPPGVVPAQPWPDTR